MTASASGAKCPKCCPKQCEACPAPAVVPDGIASAVMDEIVDSAYAEKTGKPPRQTRTPANSLQVDKYCINDFEKSDECTKIPLTLPVAIQLLKNWYRDASYEAEDALYDVKCIWNSSEGELSRKLRATNRLFIYYLLILAIYIIQLCFVIDEKLFEGLCKIIASRNDEKIDEE